MLRVTPADAQSPDRVSMNMVRYERLTAETAMSDMWEYRVEMVAITTSSTLQTMLNAAGKEGWELVACPLTNASPAVQAFIFKRLTSHLLDKPHLKSASAT